MHETPIHAAVYPGNVKILSLLIEHGADIEGQSSSIFGGTSLNRAACGGRLEFGQYLLNRRANINACDSHPTDPCGIRRTCRVCSNATRTRGSG